VSKILWMTGLSGAGKTTLARGLEARLKALGAPCFVLDGDVLRKGLCSDLTLTPKHRNENVRRASHVAALLAQAGVNAVCAFMSPYAAGRRAARQVAAQAGIRFLEIHVRCPVEECRKRDPKGLYRRFDEGEIKGMVGIDIPYEETPEGADIVLDTADAPLKECLDRLLEVMSED